MDSAEKSKIVVIKGLNPDIQAIDTHFAVCKEILKGYRTRIDFQGYFGVGGDAVVVGHDADVVEENIDELSSLESQNVGKPVSMIEFEMDLEKCTGKCVGLRP